MDSENKMKDDPELDGTDLAHPAWWRGNDEGVRALVSQLMKKLEEGGPDAVVSRIRELASKTKAVDLSKIEVGDFVYRALSDNPGVYQVLGRKYSLDGSMDPVATIKREHPLGSIQVSVPEHELQLFRLDMSEWSQHAKDLYQHIEQEHPEMFFLFMDVLHARGGVFDLNTLRVVAEDWGDSKLDLLYRYLFGRRRLFSQPIKKVFDTPEKTFELTYDVQEYARECGKKPPKLPTKFSGHSLYYRPLTWTPGYSIYRSNEYGLSDGRSFVSFDAQVANWIVTRTYTQPLMLSPKETVIFTFKGYKVKIEKGEYFIIDGRRGDSFVKLSPDARELLLLWLEDPSVRQPTLNIDLSKVLVSLSKSGEESLVRKLVKHHYDKYSTENEALLGPSDTVRYLSLADTLGELCLREGMDDTQCGQVLEAFLCTSDRRRIPVEVVVGQGSLEVTGGGIPSDIMERLRYFANRRVTYRAAV
jgi:hypothetical protein